MHWYCKEWVSFLIASSGSVTSYLNKLNDRGVPPENIKIVGMENNWLIVYYYFSEEIDK